ncbi:Putative two-component sensor histidine kinase [hydrothermal vent metagenome]|uniref:Putative two-component sensor histidine kinase n=1 Tax=hydrothermal vent metagenome TaxID=652676 RepID=A0A1W1CFS9_9ZZZZ
MLLEQYKDAIENSNIVSKTDIHGIITFVNDEFCKISGYTKEELIGKNHNVVRHPDVPKSNFKLLWDTITAKKTFKSTVKNRAKDGTDFYLNTTITPILDKSGNIEEFIAIRYNVTKEIELKIALQKQEIELERRVKEQTRKLQELNKTLETRVKEEIQKNEEKQKILFMQSRFASLGQMIANIAHQWRQPLAELNLTLFSMRKSSLIHNQKKMELYYKESKNIIKNMSDTIEDFSNFFNPNKPKKSFYIDDAINDALHILEKEILQLEISVTTKLQKVKVVGVSNELTQVIINLLQNSKDAFKLNKTIKPKINITLSSFSVKNHSYTKICFIDNAGGIKKENLESIFEPYFSTKHPNMGIGLGLFMSRMIIQKSLHGIMDVENYKDGTKFIIIIPLKEQKADV